MAEEKNAQLDKLLRKAAAEKYGLGPIVEDIEKIKPFMDKMNTMQDIIKGDAGHSPEFGKDYMTSEDQQAIIDSVTPRKGEHYFDGAPGQDGYTPQKGVDYLTDPELEDIRTQATPVKGVHYFTPDEVSSFKEAVTPVKGTDYNDGENPTPAQFLEVVKGLKGQDAASFSQIVGSKIDISHVRNAGTFIFNGKQYKTEELMHGGGSGGSGGGSVTSVSVSTVHGFAGTVANPTTTPSISISTTVTGIIKGDGTSISAATANTDYQVPITLTTTGSSGAATFDGTTLNIPQYSGGGSGTVTTVSVVSANGLAGTVANATTTPAITLSTSITGILKGNGTAISAASAGTDYTNLAFKTYSVSGQSDIVAASAEDTFTFAAGTNVTITTNAGTKTMTFAASGGGSGGNGFAWFIS